MIDDAQTRETHQAMPITVRVREACRLTGIGRSKLYELIAAGELEIIKVGTITLVPIASLTRFLQRKTGYLQSHGGDWVKARWRYPAGSAYYARSVTGGARTTQSAPVEG